MFKEFDFVIDFSQPNSIMANDDAVALSNRPLRMQLESSDDVTPLKP